VAYFGTLTVQKHNAFLSTAFDLGNVDQTVWNTRHGRPFAMTNIQGLEVRLGTHVEPILLPVSLLYFLWSDPRALLLLQTLVIGLGAWPVYLLARRQWSTLEARGRPMGDLSALVFALAYLLFPALQSANYFDFHAVALAPTFFLFALYFLETERWGAFGLFALLTMSCKEDAPLLVLMLGLYALLVRRRPWIGLATIASSLAWFGLAVGWIMPHFDTRGVSPLANRYAYLGDGPVEMALTMLTRPGLVLERLFTVENLAYLRDLLAPTAFLSLLAPHVLALALPSLAVNLLSTDGFMHQLEGFHYGAPLAPIVVASAAYGTGWLVRSGRPLASQSSLARRAHPAGAGRQPPLPPRARLHAPGSRLPRSVARGDCPPPPGRPDGRGAARRRSGGCDAPPQPPCQPATAAPRDRRGPGSRAPCSPQGCWRERGRPISPGWT
jgi:uncharacterized membrane protein